MTDKTNQLPNLEGAMEEITQLIHKMEHDELTLEQSLTHFGRGINLVKHCQKILEEAEQKVQILLQQNSQEVLMAYGEDKVEGIEINELST